MRTAHWPLGTKIPQARTPPPPHHRTCHLPPATCHHLSHASHHRTFPNTCAPSPHVRPKATRTDGADGMKMVHYMYLYLSSTFQVPTTPHRQHKSSCDHRLGLRLVSAVNADMHTMRGPSSNHSPGPTADTITCAARFVPSSIARSR